MVNQREQKLTPKRHHRVTNDLSLVGLDYLWKVLPLFMAVVCVSFYTVACYVFV